MKTPLPTTLILTVALASLTLPAAGSAQVSLRGASETPADANAQNTPLHNDDRIVELNAFIVTSETDRGYLASSAISGTKTNTPLRDLPINIAVITESVLQDLNLSQTSDALAYIGSINVTAQGQVNTPNIGLNFDAQLTVRGSGTFYNLRNGFRSYDQPSAIATQRVEVIRGPASVLYGITKPGGVVNFITKLPQHGRDSGYARYSFGSHANNRSTLEVNRGRLFNDKLAVRFAGSYLDGNTWYRFSKHHESVINPSLSFRPFSDTQVTVEYERIRRVRPSYFGYLGRSVTGYRGTVPIWYQPTGPDDPASALFPIPGFTPRDLLRGYGQFTRNPVDNLTVNLTQRIGGNLSLNLQFGHTRRENITDGFSLFTTNAWNVTDLPGVGPLTPEIAPPQPFVPQPRFRRQYEYFSFFNDVKNYGLNAIYKRDTRLPFVGLIRNKIVVGASRLDESFRQTQLWEYVPGTNNRVQYIQELRPDAHFGVPADALRGEIRPLTPASEENDFDSLFASYAGEMFDSRLILNAGITRSEFKQTRRWGSFVSYPEMDNNSPLLGAIVRPKPWLGLFVQKSRSFNPNTSARDGFNNFLQPELGRGFEYGIKLDPWESKLVATLSSFRIYENDRVIFDPNAPNRNSFFIDAAGERVLISGPNDPRFDPDLENQQKGANANVGQALSQGVDLDLVYSPNRALQFFASYAYLDAYVSRDNNTTMSTRVGRPLPNMVRHRASLLSKYNFQDGPFKGFDVVLGVTWRDKVYRDSGNLDNGQWDRILTPYDRYAEAQWNGNFKLGYKREIFGYRTDFALNVWNLFEARNWSGFRLPARMDNDGGIQTNYATAPTEPYYYKTPREFSFSVGVAF